MKTNSALCVLALIGGTAFGSSIQGNPVSLGAVSSGMADGDLIAQIALAETGLTQLVDDMDMVVANPLVSGTILMWSGATNRVPTGWVICDGSNGTPDMRNRFVQGTAMAGDVRAQGGVTNHTHVATGHEHPVPTPGHMHSITNVEGVVTEYGGAHTHEVGPATGGSIHVNQLGFGGEAVAAEGHTHTLTTRSTTHKHRLSIPEHATLGTDGNAPTSEDDSAVANDSSLPPYYALCFIMKLPEKPVEEGSAAVDSDLSGRIATVQETTAQISADLKAALSNTAPAGLVSLWSATPDTLPANWRVCDGNSDTPDLRDRFVLGAWDGSDVNEVGGSYNHTHATHAHSHRVTLPSHSHGIAGVNTVTHTEAEHRHTFNPASSCKNTEVGSDRYEMASLRSHTHTVSLAGGHSHALELPGGFTQTDDGLGWTGLTDSRLTSSGHLPRYCKLSYVVKNSGATGTYFLNLALATSDAKIRIEALEKAASTAVSALSNAVAYAVPVGAIAIWSGDPESLPPGWHACNGLGGTPDLRDRFILGSEGEPGRVGGSAEHSHMLGNHQHTAFFPHTHNHPTRELRTLTIYSGLDFDTRHVHDFTMLCASVSDLEIGGDFEVATDTHNHELEGPTQHEHGVAVNQTLFATTESLSRDTTEATYATYAAGHLPPYRKMLFIMKASDASAAPALVSGPSTVVAGASLTVRWTVTNLSATLSGGTRFGRYYLSKDEDYDAGTDRYLGDMIFDPTLLIQGTYSSALQFAMPKVSPGEYRVIVLLDKDKLVLGTSSNNTLRTAAIEVRVPDLSPIAFTAPKGVDAGQSVVAEWTVANQGNAEAQPSWTDRVYLSADNKYNAATDRYLGDADHAQALAINGTYAANLKFTMPNVPPGLYYLIVEVDRYDKVYERAETNQFRTVPIEVRVSDLSPIAFTAPKVVDAGQSVVAEWTVSNQGNTEARPSWTDRVYLSADDKYSSATDRYLGDADHAQALAVNDTYTANLKFTMPNVPPGSYYLILEVDRYDKVYETTETNQFLVTPIQIRVPDLSPIAFTAPKVVDAGQSVVAEWMVANQGNTEARPSWTDRVYLSADDKYSSATDRYLGDVDQAQTLAVSNTYTANLKFTMPNVPPGSYYLILEVDRYDKVYETTETNQFRVTPIQIRVPDLEPVQLIVPAVATVGGKVGVSWTVVNQGDGEARPAWTDRLYLSADDKYSSATDRYLGDVVHDRALAAGGGYQASMTFTMPEVPPGTYYLIIEVDHYSKVYESNEKNNLRILAAGAGQTATWLTWESIRISNGKVQLTWPSTEERSYAVEFTPELMITPFSCIASNLPATLPKNTYLDDVRPPKGFYRLRLEP